MTNERHSLPTPTPARVTPSDLVTPTALRVARAGYEAARVPTNRSARTVHRARLAVAVTAAAPYVAGEALARWSVFFDRKHQQFERMMAEEAEQHGETTQYHCRHGMAMGMELACILTGGHVLALRRTARWLGQG
ncbi:hypothetical protein [Haloechinothrix salitolerans]|uniref:Uncharacterized protein n=1 Tax=Haloechinothrix salitolerans TaxID=926830 RepID=A0ABW2BYM3_9PSEU